MSPKSGPTLAVVLARGGSKSIPKKNLKKLRGTPLVSWVIRALKNSPSVDAILLSSDDQEILDLGASEKVELHVRSPIDSQDSTSSEQSLIASLESFDKEEIYRTIILVQPTSPFTRSLHFEEAISHFFSGNYDSLVTGTSRNVFRWELGEDGVATPDYDPENRPLRQEREHLFVENGAFFIVDRNLLSSTSCRLGGKIGLYQMPDFHSWEIDEPFDWIVLESIAENINLTPEKTVE